MRSASASAEHGAIARAGAPRRVTLHHDGCARIRCATRPPASAGVRPRGGPRIQCPRSPRQLSGHITPASAATPIKLRRSFGRIWPLCKTRIDWGSPAIGCARRAVFLGRGRTSSGGCERVSTFDGAPPTPLEPSTIGPSRQLGGRLLGARYPFGYRASRGAGGEHAGSVATCSVWGQPQSFSGRVADQNVRRAAAPPLSRPT
jgi:hypothetical protein